MLKENSDGKGTKESEQNKRKAREYREKDGRSWKGGKETLSANDRQNDRETKKETTNKTNMEKKRQS